MVTLVESFLEGCKAGNLELVAKAVRLGVDVNHCNGWGLRRAIRYNRPEVWQFLLRSPGICTNINLTNKFGLSALHTACRFGMCDVVLLLLQHPTIRINEKTSQGSSPLMVAVKYGKKTIVDVLIKDCRVDLGTMDNQGRTLFDVIGVANKDVQDDVRKEIKELLKAEINKRSLRKKKKGIHNGLDPGQLIVKQAREKVNKLVNDLEETQRVEMLRFQENLENNRREFNDKQQKERENFMLKIKEEESVFFQMQETQRNKFRLEMEKCKQIFMRMQQEAVQQLLINEQESLEQFKLGQEEQRKSLQWKSKTKNEEIAVNARQEYQVSEGKLTWDSLPNISNILVSDSLYSYDKLLSEPLYREPSRMMQSFNIGKDIPPATNTWRKSSCPASLAGTRPAERQQIQTSPFQHTPPLSPSILSLISAKSTPRLGLCVGHSRNSPLHSYSSNSSNSSPVPSLEYISPQETFVQIPDTCPNIKALVYNPEVWQMPAEPVQHESLQQRTPPKSPSTIKASQQSFSLPNPPITYNNTPESTPKDNTSYKTTLTPRLTRRMFMEVLKEEEDDIDEQGLKDDLEIEELTNSGIVKNKSSSFTNLVSNMKSPSPCFSRNAKEEEQNLDNRINNKMFFIELENDQSEDKRERSKSLPKLANSPPMLNENISKEYSGISLASSASTCSFKSAETSPVKGIGCWLA